jgi:hypothetical protein
MSGYIDGNDTYPGGGGHPSDCRLADLRCALASQRGAAIEILQ